MAAQVFAVLCSFPDSAVAQDTVEKAVSERLAACGHLLPAGRSLYRWKGKLETADEVLAILKTSAEAYPALERFLSAVHPYDIPEIICLPVQQGFTPYLEWVGENSGGASAD